MLLQMHVMEMSLTNSLYFDNIHAKKIYITHYIKTLCASFMRVSCRIIASKSIFQSLLCIRNAYPVYKCLSFSANRSVMR